MKKVFLIILGVLLISRGIYDFTSGETIGFGTMSVGGNKINQLSNPIEFLLVIIFEFFLGGWSIKTGFSKSDLK